MKNDIIGSVNSYLFENKLTELIKAISIERARTGLGGSHTVVTYPPLDSLREISPDEVINVISPVHSLNLYQHIAFCEHICPFCSYTTLYSDISSERKPDPYLKALFREMDLWFEHIANQLIDSVYIGGGTPTVLSLNHLNLLFEKLNIFKRAARFSACIETSPPCTVANDGLEKLKVAREWGINRVSIGIQSFSTDLLRTSRNYDKDVAISSLELLSSLEIEINIDLIQDLPNQTIDQLFEDLEQIERYKPHQVTWYIFRANPYSGWYHAFKKGELHVITSLESIMRRQVINEAMNRIGYIRKPGGRYVLDEKYHDKYKSIRSGNDTSMLGMGVSAYSHAWDYFFRNIHSGDKKTRILGYIDILKKGRLPIETGMYLDSEQKLAGSVVRDIRSGINLTAPAHEGINYASEATQLLQKLLHLGLIDLLPNGECRVSALGSLLEEEICSLFYSSATKWRLASVGSYWYLPFEQPKGLP